MKRTSPATSSKLFLAVVSLLTLCSLALLLRLLHNFETSTAHHVQELQRVFSDPGLLKPDQPVFSFAEIESAVSKYENQGEFGEITITRRSGGTENVVYPFYLTALQGINLPEQRQKHPIPGDKSRDVRALELRAGDHQIGTLYVRVHTGSLMAVRGAIASLGGLLLASIALFLTQFRRQEITISRTLVELDEKRNELVRLERLALAGQISANIFHDLKKPVLNIKHEWEELEPVDRDTGIGKRIRQQIELFFGILRDTSLERFVRAGEESEFVDLNEVLERSLALVKYERGDVSVIRQLSDQLPPVFAQPVRLVQVFSNLVLNAYQAMGGKGELRLETVCDENMAVVRVIDNGSGITAVAQAQIFEPFYTTKPEGQGTGLGLYIVREIIQHAGGQIRVSSKPGRTCFEVLLPIRCEGVDAEE